MQKYKDFVKMLSLVLELDMRAKDKAFLGFAEKITAFFTSRPSMMVPAFGARVRGFRIPVFSSYAHPKVTTDRPMKIIAQKNPSSHSAEGTNRCVDNQNLHLLHFEQIFSHKFHRLRHYRGLKIPRNIIDKNKLHALLRHGFIDQNFKKKFSVVHSSSREEGVEHDYYPKNFPHS